VRMVRTFRTELGTTEHGTVCRVAHQPGNGIESIPSWVRGLASTWVKRRMVLSIVRCK
jgi:hypothetical protein